MVTHLPTAKPFLVAALVLAAGAGRRYGGGKLLAPFGEGRLVDSAVRTALAAPADEVVVVTGAQGEAVAAHVRTLDPDGRVRIVQADDWEDGLSASLKVGVAAVPQADAVIVLLGDMPHIPAGVLAPLVAAVRAGAPAAAPVFEGERGHPAVLGREVLDRVPGLAGDQGAGGLLKALGDRLARLPVADDGVLFDVDTPPPA